MDLVTESRQAPDLAHSGPESLAQQCAKIQLSHGLFEAMIVVYLVEFQVREKNLGQLFRRRQGNHIVMDSMIDLNRSIQRTIGKRGPIEHGQCRSEQHQAIDGLRILQRVQCGHQSAQGRTYDRDILPVLKDII